MIRNRTNLQDSLEKTIDDWSGEHAEKGTWIDSYIGDETIRLMAQAAMDVISAVDEIQDWLKADGQLED